jgi:hypothetical protein
VWQGVSLSWAPPLRVMRLRCGRRWQQGSDTTRETKRGALPPPTSHLPPPTSPHLPRRVLLPFCERGLISRSVLMQAYAALSSSPGGEHRGGHHTAGSGGGCASKVRSGAQRSAPRREVRVFLRHSGIGGERPVSLLTLRRSCACALTHRYGHADTVDRICTMGVKQELKVDALDSVPSQYISMTYRSCSRARFGGRMEVSMAHSSYAMQKSRIVTFRVWHGATEKS